MGQDASSLRILENKIGYYFQNKQLLEQAVTHDSLRVTDSNIKHYQRLEHLGDSALQLVITDYLFRANPNDTEGMLSENRARLVSRNYQQGIARKLEIERFIKMSPGVQGFNRYDKFVEALIGAVYVDAGGEERGFTASKDVIYKLWELKNPTYAPPCIVM